jgi:hypothetical protein
MLFSQMEPPPELEADFNDWYETEHIPVRLALRGFACAVRYREVGGGRRYLAVYEIDDIGVLDSPGYNVVKTQPSERTARMLKSVHGFTRFTCELISDTGAASERGRYLSAVGFAVPPDKRAQLDDWYEGDHVPRLKQVSDWLRVRRYRVISADGGPWTDFALHELRSPDALAGQPWFESPTCWLYEVISLQQAAHGRRRNSQVPGGGAADIV